MIKIINSIVFVLIVGLVYLSLNAKAEEVVLCAGQEDQYVVMVNEKGDCLEEEVETVLDRPDLAQKKTFTPLANYKNNEHCAGEGTMTEVGFDENSNGELDQNEVVSSYGTCSPVIAEESEGSDQDTAEN